MISDDEQCRWCLLRCEKPCSFSESANCTNQAALRMDGWFEYDEKDSHESQQSSR